LNRVQDEKHHIGEDVNGLSPFWGENRTKRGGPATSDEREDEAGKDNYLCNSGSLMAETDMKCGQSCKTKSPLRLQTQRGGGFLFICLRHR